MSIAHCDTTNSGAAQAIAVRTDGKASIAALGIGSASARHFAPHGGAAIEHRFGGSAAARE